MAISNVLGEEREVTLPDGPIRYRERGDGKPLVFIHGLGVNGDLWRKVAPLLQREFRCIVPDWPIGSHSVPMFPHANLSLPGLAKIVVDFMDAIDLDRATLVGNDSGGAVAQQVAVDRPDRVDRLVLNDCELYERFLPPQFKGLQLFGGRVPGALFVVGQILRFRPFQWPSFVLAAKSGLPERVIMDSYLRPGRESAAIRRDFRNFLAAVDPKYTLDCARRLKSFSNPTLVIWGDDDKLFPLDYPRRLVESMPNARLEVVRDARTFVPEDAPEALAELIAQVVREPAPAMAA